MTQGSQKRVKGVKVKHYNLGPQPMPLVEHPAVKALPDPEGVAVLPLLPCWEAAGNRHPREVVEKPSVLKPARA